MLHTYAFAEPLSWSVRQGEHWAVLGPNAAGKSQLIDIVMSRQALISGELFTAEGVAVKHVAFTNIYSFIDLENSYYQQRWNIGDEQNAKTVAEIFDGTDRQRAAELAEALELRGAMEKRINMLSSGELRKVLIVLSLLSSPKVLILDNPYIGLDVRSRGELDSMFRLLAERGGVTIIAVVSRAEDVPPITTHILPVKDKRLMPACRPGEDLTWLFDPLSEPGELPAAVVDESFDDVLIFKDVTVKYGSKVVLSGIDWRVRRGEKWLLWGRNGSGKSTLLGLLSGDNPQAYANDITLFDRRRGTGESIWDIKRRIGFISPEVSLYYRKNISCLDVVGSGFFDTIGSPYSFDDEQKALAMKWMDVFGISGLAERMFLRISSGEQQLVLLARLFVKSPSLLVLDEPLHGLDSRNKVLVNMIVEKYCTPDKSMIYVTHYEEEIPGIVTDVKKL